MNHKINISPSVGQLDTLTREVDLLIGNANVRTIFEFGSRYGEDSIEFAARYPQSAIYCFECNPKSLTILREKIELYSDIIFKKCAISDRCEIIEFFQMMKQKQKPHGLTETRVPLPYLKPQVNIRLRCIIKM